MSVPEFEQVEELAAEDGDGGGHGRRLPSPRKPCVLEATQHYADDASYPETQMYIPPCPPPFAATEEECLEECLFATERRDPSEPRDQPDPVTGNCMETAELTCIQVGQALDASPQAAAILGPVNLIEQKGSETVAPSALTTSASISEKGAGADVSHSHVVRETLELPPVQRTWAAEQGFQESIPVVTKSAAAAPCTPPAQTRRTPSPHKTISHSSGFADLAHEEPSEVPLGETQHYAVDSAMGVSPSYRRVTHSLGLSGGKAASLAHDEQAEALLGGTQHYPVERAMTASPSYGSNAHGLRLSAGKAAGLAHEPDSLLGGTQHYPFECATAVSARYGSIANGQHQESVAYVATKQEQTACALCNNDGGRGDVALMLLTPSSSKKGRTRAEQSPKTRAIALGGDLANSLLDSSPLPYVAPRSVSKAVQTSDPAQSDCLAEHQDAIDSAQVEEVPATVPEALRRSDIVQKPSVADGALEVLCQDTFQYDADPVDQGHLPRPFDACDAQAGSVRLEIADPSVPVADMDASAHVQHEQKRHDRMELLLEATQCYDHPALEDDCARDQTTADTQDSSTQVQEQPEQKEGVHTQVEVNSKINHLQNTGPNSHPQEVCGAITNCETMERETPAGSAPMADVDACAHAQPTPQRQDRLEMLLEATQCYNDAAPADPEEVQTTADDEPAEQERRQEEIDRAESTQPTSSAAAAGTPPSAACAPQADVVQLQVGHPRSDSDTCKAAVDQRRHEPPRRKGGGQAAAFEQALVEELARLQRPQTVVVKREPEVGLESAIRVALPDVKSDTVYRLTGRENARTRHDSGRAICAGLPEDPVVLDHHEEAKKAIFRRVKQEYDAGIPVKQEDVHAFQGSASCLDEGCSSLHARHFEDTYDMEAAEEARMASPMPNEHRPATDRPASPNPVAKKRRATVASKGGQVSHLPPHCSPEREHTPERARSTAASPVARVPTPCRRRTPERFSASSPREATSHLEQHPDPDPAYQDGSDAALGNNGSSCHAHSAQRAPVQQEPAFQARRSGAVQRGRSSDTLGSELAASEDENFGEENISPGWNPVPASDTGPTTGPSQPSPTRVRHKAWKRLCPSQASVPAIDPAAAPASGLPGKPDSSPGRADCNAAASSGAALSRQQAWEADKVADRSQSIAMMADADSLASRLLAEPSPPRKRQCPSKEVAWPGRQRASVKDEPLDHHQDVFVKQEEPLGAEQPSVKRRRLSKKTKLLTSLSSGWQGRVEPSEADAITRLTSLQPSAPASTVVRPCFAATGFQFSDRQRRILTKLGGSIVDVWTPDVTHLVADTFRRTTKMMCSISCGVRIVVPEFITASRAADRFVEEGAFMLKDGICEIAFARKRNLDSYSMVEAVRRRLQQGPRLSNVHVHCLPSVFEKRELPLLVAAMGGKWLPTFPGMPDYESVLLLGERAQCSEQEREWRSKHKVYDLELLREAACTQVLRKSCYRLR